MTKSFIENINRPQNRLSLPSLKEVWQYRYLLYNLILREIRIRYKQTILGFAWAIFTPLLTLLIFTFVFRTLVNVPSDNIPYPLFAAAAIVPWTLFSSGLTYASTSIVSNRELITKMYFPRILAPLSKQFSGAVDSGVALLLLFLMMLGYGYLPTAKIIFIPVLIILAMMTALGVGLWLCTFHVRFRDIGPAVPFLVQLWMYITPVGYPTTLVEGRWEFIYSLNPMVTVCDGFRWALLGTDTLHPQRVAISVVAASVVLLTGMLFFQRMEGSFPDFV